MVRKAVLSRVDSPRCFIILGCEMSFTIKFFRIEKRQVIRVSFDGDLSEVSIVADADDVDGLVTALRAVQQRALTSHLNHPPLD